MRKWEVNKVKPWYDRTGFALRQDPQPMADPKK